MDRRGYVEYTLNVPAADIYRLEIESAAHFPPTGTNTFDLLICVDSEHLGRCVLTTTGGTSSRESVFTPHLLPGPLTVQVFWDNAASYGSLAVRAVRLESISGPDADGNGRNCVGRTRGRSSRNA